MSFGYSINEIVAFGCFVYKVVQNSRKACGEHDELTSEVSAFHVALEHLETEIERPASPLTHPDDTNYGLLLTGLVRDSMKLLEKLDKILVKYNALSEPERSVKKIGKMIWFGNREMANLGDYRAKLFSFKTTMFLYLHLATAGAVGRVERQMIDAGGVLKDIKTAVEGITTRIVSRSTYEGSILTTYADDDKAVWREFRRKLVGRGFLSADVEKYMPQITAYVQELRDRGLLDDEHVTEPQEALTEGQDEERVQEEGELGANADARDGSGDGEQYNVTGRQSTTVSKTPTVVDIAAAALQASSAISHLVSAIIDAPEEIRSILKDTEDLKSIVSSLIKTLDTPKMREILMEDEYLRDHITVIGGPLEGCQMILEELRPRIQKCVKRASDQGKLKIRVSYMLYKNVEVKGYAVRLQSDMSRLQSTMSRLNMAVNEILLSFTIRGAAQESKNEENNVRRDPADIGASTAPQRSDSPFAPDDASLAETYQEMVRLEEATQTTALERLEKLKNQRNELAQAAKIGDADTIEHLIKLLVEAGTDLNILGPEGKTALHFAAWNGHASIIRTTIDQGANMDLNVKDSNGKAALHLAATEGRISVVQTLLDANADIDVRADTTGTDFERNYHGGRTPLHWAADHGHDEVVAFLIEQKADKSARSATGRSPLQDALWRGHPSVVQLLIEHGADIHNKDDNDLTALLSASQSDMLPSQVLSIVKLLVKRGADVNALKPPGVPAMSLAYWKGHIDVVVYLVREARANPRLRNRCGDQLIHIASTDGQLQTVIALLDVGVNVNVKGQKGETSLMKARGRIEIWECLLQRGADQSLRSDSGFDFLELCRREAPERYEEAKRWVDEWNKRQR